MSHSATVSLCILWEDELRTAAKLLHQAEFAYQNDMPEHAALAQQAYAACCIALHGLKDEHTLAMVAHESLRKRTKSKEGKAG